jgi:demethylmacrocin O-methyltransferase
MIDLTQLANEIGTDKGNIHGEAHNYTQVYQKYFEPFQPNPVKLLEIGIYDHRFPGASVKLWTSFFSNLELIGFEINPEAKKLEQNNTKIFIGDQGNVDHLNECIETYGGDYDIIIDDGIHKFEQIKVSFETLYPYLKKGGLYVIEDIHANDSREIEPWLKSKGYTYSSYCHADYWSVGDKLLVLKK